MWPLLKIEKLCLCKNKQSKGIKRTTRQAKALEARKAPRTFLELLHEANLELLPHMFHLIGKQLLDLEAQPAVATIVQFVDFLPIILVLDVVCASVHIVVKMYTMILVP
ncbi:hypothetical protein K1719_028104 [Acacia pycnantha]|nr:hypothetical protein K1719_028104 [Acacia pycnantha]